jgi:hypothetical protein
MVTSFEGVGSEVGKCKLRLRNLVRLVPVCVEFGVS